MNDSLVRTSAICSFVFTRGMALLEAKQILSENFPQNQHDAVWKISGFHPLMTILMTASLSSDTNTLSICVGNSNVGWPLVSGMTSLSARMGVP